jgi:hypothetical protein
MKMAKPQSPQDDFLNLVRAKLGDPQLSFDAAMQHPLAQVLFDLMASNLPETQAPSSTPDIPPPPLSSFAQSRAVIQAAIQDTFTLEEVSVGDVERAALIAATEVVMLNKERRLCLSDAARAEVLAAVSNSSLYRSTLRAAVIEDQNDFDKIGTDPVRLPTAWLRSFLQGEFGDVVMAPRFELAAALTARRRLRLVSDLPSNVPAVAELERRLTFAELLEPLRLLIGAQGGWDRIHPATDRFVGRQSELAQLRGFVDELSSQSALEALGRIATSVKTVLTQSERPNLLLVQADGGLGKSALLAKFVLDHALDQSRPFPFAYLDFDNAALDPNEPNQLLIEMARQVGLQFPAAQPEFSALIDDIRQDRRQTSPADTSSTEIRDPFASFVEVLRKHATLGRRAFLLILDTLEVVQWNPAAIDRVASILYQFRAKGLVELRVVASGRADIPQLRAAAGLATADDNIRLRPLSLDEAIEMANRLGKAAIGAAWDPTWSRAIVGDSSGSGLLSRVKRVLRTREDLRREPLTVRVAVDLVLQVEDPKQRESIVQEILDLSDNSQTSLAARLYQRRILSHVRNENARKLAWPGLVLRRVTLAIVRDLLAPLSNLAPEEVDDAYQSLAKEVWMVVQDGDGLKHLPHLRARTLPLMRATDPKLFESTARAAIDYFGRLRESSREDRAEWIYQRLLLGSDINEVAADIAPDILPKLAGAAEDFPEDSDAASFLASRTATTRLSPPRIRSLTPTDALFHFRTTAQTVFGFDDLSVDQVALEVSVRLSENRATIGAELLPWAQTLWIKTGIWRDLGIPKSKLQDFPRPIQRASLFWAARSAPHLQMEWKTHLLEFSLQQIAAFVEDSDLGFRGATQALALARGLKAFDAFAVVDERITRMISGMKPNPQASTQAALRTAIVLGDKCRLPAIDLWLKGRRRGARDRVKDPTFSSSELRMLARIDADAFSLLENWGQAGTDGFFRIADDETVSSAARILEQSLASPLDQFAGSDLGRGLARVFACRDEDWIIPFGYAAERLAGGIYPDALRERISDYAGPRNSKFRASVPAWSDMLGAMRIADEAGDLQGFAQQILDQGLGSADARADLARLLQSRDEWARKTDELIGRFDGILEAPVYDAVSEPPPAPGPILDKDDPQRGRWGGKNEGFGRTLKVTLESVESKVFFFSLIVESTDGTALEPPAVFHLHDTFPRSIIHIRRIVDGKLATLNDWSAYGVFTVGVQVKDGTGRWISLELNLASIPKLPARFLRR